MKKQHEDYIEGMAKALWACECAAACEDVGKPMRGQIMDQIGKPPTLAYKLAHLLRDAVETINGLPIEDILHRAGEAARCDLTAELRETWGHYAAMASMGHGVSWEDTYPGYGYKNTHYAEHASCYLEPTARRWAIRTFGKPIKS
jgi:hypothetical protein